MLGQGSAEPKVHRNAGRRGARNLGHYPTMSNQLSFPKTPSPNRFAAFDGADVEAFLLRGDLSSFGDLSWSRFGVRVQARMPDNLLPTTFAEVAKLVEDSASAVYYLSRASTMQDVVVTVATFVRSVTGKSVVHSAITSDCVQRLVDALGSGLQAQSTPWIENLSRMRNVLTKYELVRGSRVFKKVHELLMYVLSFGLLERFGVTFDKLRYGRLEKEAIKKDFTSCPNFVFCILDTITFVLERGVSYMRTGRWTTFLHTGDKYEEWFDKSCRIREHAQLLNDPELHGFDEPLFVKELAEVLDIGTAIYDEAKTIGAAERRIVSKVLSEMRMIKASYLNSVKAREMRDVPFSMVLVGPSSIGKSQLITFFISLFAKWQNLPVGDEYIYTYMADQEYWSGFMSSMWALILDDVGALRASLAEAGLDKLLLQIVSIVNSIPLVTNQAAVEDKGTVPFRGKFVIATANTAHMNAQFVYQYPIAMLRRLPIVLDMKLHPDYERDNMLDKVKARDSGLEFPDFYLFTVQRVVPLSINGRIDPRSCQYVTAQYNGVVLQDVGLMDVLQYLRNEVREHDANQAHVRVERTKFYNMVVCNCCGLPEQHCMRVQSAPVPEPVSPVVRAVVAEMVDEVANFGGESSDEEDVPQEDDHEDEEDVPDDVREANRGAFLRAALQALVRREPEEPVENFPQIYINGFGHNAQWCLRRLLDNGYMQAFPGFVSFVDYIPRRWVGQAYGRFISYTTPGTYFQLVIDGGERLIVAQPWVGEPETRYMSRWRAFCATLVSYYLYGVLGPMIAVAMWCCTQFPNWEAVFMRRKVTRFVLMMYRGMCVLTNAACDLGFRPFADRFISLVVTPDAPMRQIYTYLFKQVACFMVNDVFWKLMIYGAIIGNKVCVYIMAPLLVYFPAFIFAYLAPYCLSQVVYWRRISQILARAGDREATGFRMTRTIVTIVAAIVAMKAATTIMTKLGAMMFEVQGEEEDAASFDADAKQPTPHEADEVRANVWYKDDYAVTPMDAAPAMKGVGGKTPEELVAMIDRSIIYVESRYAGKVRDFRALQLCDNIYVTNTHNLEHYGAADWRMTAIWTQQRDQVSSNVEFSMDESLVKHLGGDVSLFKIPVRPTGRNILNWIASKTFRGRYNGFRAIRMPDGTMLIERRTGYLRKNQNHPELGEVDVWISHGSKSLLGYCGSVYFSESVYGPAIIGIHTLGSESAGLAGAVALNREDLMAAIDEWNPLHVQGCGPRIPVSALREKAPVRFIESGNLDVFGTVPASSSNRSRVELSCTSRFFMSRGVELRHGRPVMRGWEPNRRALLGVVLPRTTIRYDLIQRAVRDYVDQVINEVDEADFSVLHMVDERTAILGCPGIPHLERLAMSTSAGYPFNKPKRACISEMGEITDMDVRREVDRIKACYARGERAYPIFNACYKDEPTSFEKIAANKTRVFLISNLAFTIVCRQMLMGHIRFFTSHRFACEMAIGINCHSEEWGELRDYLVTFGVDRCDDGDMAGFDMSQAAPFVEAAFEVITLLASRAGAALPYLRKLQCLKYDIMFAVVNWFGTLVQFHKQNPSGNSATTQINCLVISLIMRCAYFTLVDVQRPFREFVHLIGYGDDSCQNVSEQISPLYNHVTVARALSEIGFTYTMAQKGDVAVPFRNVDQLSFLKRAWVWDDTVRAYLAPLERKSIDKSLIICLPSKAVSEEQRAVDCLSSALREMFHHGRLAFGEFRTMALECVEECKLSPWVSRNAFPTYVELQAQFYDASQHVYARQGRVAPVQLTLPAAQTESELLLEVQGGAHSKRMADSFSRLGDPRSWFLPKRRQDATPPPPDDMVRVDLSDVKLRPATTFFSRASDALNSHQKHLAAVNPLVWGDIQRLESRTDCLCEFCRPMACDLYGCAISGCPECARMFAPTACCPHKQYVNETVYWKQWKREAMHPFYVELDHVRDLKSKAAHAMADEFDADVFAWLKSQGHMVRDVEPLVEAVDWNDWDQDDLQTLRYLVAQSGESDVMSVTESAEAGEDSHIVAHFLDHTTGVKVDYPKLYRDVRDGEHREIAELKNFLSRPVLIETITWSETRAVPYGWGPYAPWYLFFNNTVIKNRLHNFSAIACTLKIKIVVNASPFYYGSQLWSYVPACNNSISDVALLDTVDAANIVRSQLPHVWVYPSNQQGGEITCPFFFQQNWLPLTASETQAMGTLQGVLVNQLQSANGTSGASVTVQIWAWAEDVRLMGPTINLAVQSRSRDEYGKKPISAPASAVSAVAKSLSRVPVIGAAATAVGDVADAVGEVASFFGFSKVPVIEPTTPMVPKPFAHFASTDIGTAVEKLSLDTKNDLSIDPRIGGLPEQDELALQGLFARESYLCTCTFSTTNSVDDILFGSLVQPHGLLGVNPTGNSNAYPLYYSTPIDYFTRMFSFWRGPIVFRFKVVASPYHQGRVRLTYDPVGDISANVPDYASVFNEIIDIAQTSDFEIVVPYMQAVGWCRQWDDQSACYATNGALGHTHSQGNDNGMVILRAVTVLTAPVSSSTINIQVFVRAGEEYEVAAPKAPPSGITFLGIQSGERDAAEVAYGTTHQVIISDQKPVNHEDLFLVNMGEKVTSLRQLMNRTTHGYSTQYVGISSSNQQLILTMYQTPFPAWYGYSSTGHHTANTQSGTPATQRFNFCTTSAWHMAVACFAGMRGSMQWSFNVDTTSSSIVPSHMAVTRHFNTFNTGNYQQSDTIATMSVNNTPAAFVDNDWSAGGALTNTRTNTGLQVLVPFYNQYRFVPATSSTGETGASIDGSDLNNMRLKVVFNPAAANPTNVRVDRYYSIGPDFQCLFYLAAAPWSILSSVTPT